MDCRIVGAICKHNFPQTQKGLVSFQRKEAHFFEKVIETVTLTNFFIYMRTHVSTKYK